jgi:DNA repair protein RecN (Recombination protein N)
LIETLRISGLAIVDEAELEFDPGLNVLTGETGAGKSIVLSALALLAGGRGRGKNEDGNASVEAVFRTDCHPEFEVILGEQGLLGEDHELVVTRTFSSGRSRSRVSGQLLPVNALSELFTGRLEISSQHDSQALLRTETHSAMLDRKGNLLPLRKQVGEAYRALRAIDDEIAELLDQDRDRAQRQDFLSFQVKEIDDAKLDVDEMNDLATDRSRLAHAERLRVEGGSALARLNGDPHETSGGAADALREASRSLEALADVDAALGELGERLAGLAVEAQEAAADLERHLDGIEADPARLARMDERLHQVEQLQRKYGVDVEAVLRHRDEAASLLAALEGADERVAKLRAERESQVDTLEKLARKLSRGRKSASKALAKEVEAGLQELAMQGARFDVALHKSELQEGFPSTPTGLEAPEFVFNANPGRELQPLRKVASGGELSRAFLAIKGALREAGEGMVLVFDEVDAGIGGEAADRVGRCLAQLAETHQVLCITHLPQIAAYASLHFCVTKRQKKGTTRTLVAPVSGEERVDELARMAGGAKPGDAAREYARELLARCGRV